MAGGIDAQLDYLLRIAEVEKQVGLGRSAIYRRMAEETFPAPLAIGGGQVRWRQSDITQWIRNLEQAAFRAPVKGRETAAGA